MAKRGPATFNIYEHAMREQNHPERDQLQLARRGGPKSPNVSHSIVPAEPSVSVPPVQVTPKVDRASTAAAGPSEQPCGEAAVSPVWGWRAASRWSRATNRPFSVTRCTDSSDLTDSTTDSSSSVTHSAHCCVCNVASDSELIPPSRRRCDRAGNLGKPFPWLTFVPIVGLTIAAAFLFLFVISTAVQSQRMMMAFAPKQSSEGRSAQPTPGATTKSDQSAVLEGHLVNAITTHLLEDGHSNGTKQGITTEDPTAASTLTMKSPHGTHTRPLRRIREGTVTKTRVAENHHRKAAKGKAAFPIRHTARKDCGTEVYTFCARPKQEYYYRRASNSCVVTSADAVHPCNRGANRFASLRHCLRSCVSTEQPADQCFQQPLFTSCAREDMVSSWWHLQGNTCVPWDFSGGCPSKGSAVFPTARECQQLCGGPRRRSPCRPPTIVACGGRHVKYPHFAHLSAQDGRLRCIRSSVAMLRGLQCLAGANRYRTLRSCHASCTDRR